MEYNIKSISTQLWGSHVWYYMHFVAIAYIPSESDKIRMKNFFYNLSDNIPCPTCQEHFKTYLAGISDDLWNEILQDSDSVFKFTVDMHNMVNTALGKPIINLDDARNMYNNLIEYIN